jgi:hypothetical protein
MRTGPLRLPPGALPDQGSGLARVPRDHPDPPLP